MQGITLINDYYTSLRLRQSTKKRLIETRGKMEFKNGKRRSIEDVLNELIDFFNKHKETL